MRKVNLATGYDDIPQPGNPRHTEAWALARCARTLRESAESDDKETMARALRLNWQLWTIIQADLLDEKCSLPDEIRQNALSLANFVDKHTVSIIGRPAPADMDILISINRELSAGLYEKPADEAPSEPNPGVVNRDITA